jgi:hypothetical protein
LLEFKPLIKGAAKTKTISANITKAPTPIKKAIPLLLGGLVVGAGLIIVVAINIYLIPFKEK